MPQLLPNQNALVAVSRGMQAVKQLCSDTILKFLTGLLASTG